MAMIDRRSSAATEATVRAKLTFSAAWRDGVITPCEAAQIEMDLDDAYLLNETLDCAAALSEQLNRLGENAPNKPMIRRIHDVTQLWVERAKRRPLSSNDNDLDAA